MARCVVTGGCGFVGAHLVRRLLRDGWEVAVVDNLLRGDRCRIADIQDHIELHTCDVRDPDAVTHACSGAEVVFHLAAINGTRNFYDRPELVLDVGVRGALSVVQACQRADVPDLVVASSAEVYQAAPSIPTDERAPLMLPDSLNPRYSYGGSKIISELIAFNYGREHFRKVQVFRPHNVYGPDMGWKHVVPQLILRAFQARDRGDSRFPIQSDGTETRAFAFVEDVVSGIVLMHVQGGHRQIFHIGNDRETSIRALVAEVATVTGADLNIIPGAAAEGGAPRRCPDISKMRALGFVPRTDLRQGLRDTAEWYAAHSTPVLENPLM